MKIGDRVVHKNASGVHAGTIKDVDPFCDQYLVEFDDKQLIPPTMWISYNYLDQELPFGATQEAALWDIYGLNEENPKKCSCGAKFTSFPNAHTDWCELYTKEVKS